MTDNKDLIAEARERAPRGRGPGEFLLAIADALEAATERASQAEAELRDVLRVDVPSLKAERDAALAAIERVREIHKQHPVVSTGFPALTTDYVYCANGCEYPCKTVAALDGAPEPGLSESERLELEGTPYVWSPDSLAYQLDGWVNDLGLPGNSLLEEIGVQEGVYYADQSVLSEKLQEVTIAWLETHGYRRDGAPEPEWEVQYGRRNRETGALHWLTGDPRDDWWHENQDRYEHVKRYTSPPLPVEGEKP